jgi:hypothetical protein
MYGFFSAFTPIWLSAAIAAAVFLTAATAEYQMASSTLATVSAKPPFRDDICDIYTHVKIKRNHPNKEVS